ncbi:MAG: hypothetical protein R2864_15265 [Syntrophotaleaceae bacterium]
MTRKTDPGLNEAAVDADGEKTQHQGGDTPAAQEQLSRRLGYGQGR